MRSNIERLLKGSSHFKNAEQETSVWLSQMQGSEGDEHLWKSFYSGCFLLTLLPNVTKIALPLEWMDFPGPIDEDQGGPLWSLLDSIVKRANAHETESLRKLEIIQPSTGISCEYVNGTC